MTKYPHCFSTLGCPDLSIKEAVALAQKHAVEAIELRLISGSLDVPLVLEAEFGTPAKLQQFLAEQGIGIAGIGTSIRLLGDAYDGGQIEPFLPWVEVAGIPFLRVFDGGAELSDADYDMAGERLGNWQMERERRGLAVDLMIETHNALVVPEQLYRFVRQIPEAKILWDTHHTWAKGGTDLAETWSNIAQSVVHLHVKDSVADGDGRRYVLPGLGGFPMADLKALIAEDSRGLPMSLEWERHWHKALPPLDEALSAARGWW